MVATTPLPSSQCELLPFGKSGHTPLLSVRYFTKNDQTTVPPHWAPYYCQLPSQTAVMVDASTTIDSEMCGLPMWNVCRENFKNYNLSAKFSHYIIPCCSSVSASISVEGTLLAVGAPLCELGDDGTDGRAEESGAASVKVGHIVKVEWNSVWFTCMHCECRTGTPLASWIGCLWWLVLSHAWNTVTQDWWHTGRSQTVGQPW